MRAEEAMDAASSASTDPAVLAAGGSVLLSLYLFYVRGSKEQGIFVGLWAPTIFAFTSYFKQTRMASRLEMATGTAEGMRGTVERIIGGQ
jgi:hypothetical protein